MQINVSGHHVEVTESLREYTSKKINKAANHGDEITNIQITLSVEKLRQKAEAMVHVKGADIVASAEDQDMYAAIDLLAVKLNRQLIKNKEKKRKN